MRGKRDSAQARYCWEAEPLSTISATATIVNEMMVIQMIISGPVIAAPLD